MSDHQKVWTRRSFVAGGALALTSATAYAVVPRRAEHLIAREKLGNLVARRVGPWQAVSPAGVIVTNEELENSDGYDQLLTRVCAAAGLPTIMLLIAYGSTQGGNLQLHRPETCYPGQGFKLGEFEEMSFPFGGDKPVRARLFTARRDDRIERVMYWTRIADSFPRNSAEEYRTILGSVLHGTKPDGTLVRVSTIGENIAESDAALIDFARQMIRSTSAVGRQVLLGHN